jgi:ubiquinone/menaquinone biosynthesis C-methylase UbiE
MDNPSSLATFGLDKRDYLGSVVDYWDSTTELYLQHMSTFQAGLLRRSADEDAFKESNLRFAQRAGIKPGDCILDAGCGVCGPSIDFAKYISGLDIRALTISSVQARIAKRLVKAARLQSKIRIELADYHSIPYPDNYFDSAIFLESFGYSNDPESLLKEVERVLRPGGTLYIKDIFRHERMDMRQTAELMEFNSTYVYQSHPVSKVLKALATTNFTIVSNLDITKTVDRRHTLGSMFRDPANRRGITPFGRVHYRGFECLPIRFYEIKAQKKAFIER